MTTSLPNGSIVALITPFNEDGSVNFDKLEELVEWHIANKTDGILVLGTTGESSTMSHEEDDAVLDCVIKKANKEFRLLPEPEATPPRHSWKNLLNTKRWEPMVFFLFLLTTIKPMKKE